MIIRGLRIRRKKFPLANWHKWWTTSTPNLHAIHDLTLISRSHIKCTIINSVYIIKYSLRGYYASLDASCKASFSSHVSSSHKFHYSRKTYLINYVTVIIRTWESRGTTALPTRTLFIRCEMRVLSIIRIYRVLSIIREYIATVCY